MLRVVDVDRPSVTTEQFVRADILCRSLLYEHERGGSDRTRAVLAAVMADPSALRSSWLASGPGDGPLYPSRSDDDDTLDALVVLGALVCLGSSQSEILGVLESIGDALGASPAQRRSVVPDVEAVLLFLRDEDVTLQPTVSPAVRAIIDRTRTLTDVDSWVGIDLDATDLLKPEDGVGMVLAGAADFSGSLLPPAAGKRVPVRIVTGENESVAGAAPNAGVGEVVIGLSSIGWWTGADDVVIRNLSSDTMLEARISAWRSAGGGRPLLRALGAESSGPFGVAVVEPLPDEVGDGVTVHRVIIDTDDVVMHHVDVVRSLNGIDIVVGAVIAEPAWLLTAAVELLRLNLSITSQVGSSHA